MKTLHVGALLPLLFLPLTGMAQTAATVRHMTGVWQAKWITVPDSDPYGYGVYHFRKDFTLNERPTSPLVVKVSADNRYKLYVNGRMVALGPARNDIQHWNYDTLDIAGFLKTGRNCVAACVWNDGMMRPAAIISKQTGFILCGTGPLAAEINTNQTWKCQRDEAYKPIPLTPADTGPGEAVDLRRHDTRWNTPDDAPDSTWKTAKELFYGCQTDMAGYSYAKSWMLQLSPIPRQELRKETEPLLMRRLRVDGRETLSRSKPFSAVTVRPHSTVQILLDRTQLTNAYVTIGMSGGKDATVKVTYQEALYAQYPHKGNRNDILGKTINGRWDSIVCNGRTGQRFSTLDWRTYRYMQLDIATASEPLVIDSVTGVFTGYPFRLKANIDTGDKELQQIFDTGWHTARLCAVDTYMDCPYYERLQYLGDTRIQALVSLYCTDDHRLVRNFLTQAALSLTPEGILQSRYPCWERQLINLYSISFIAALHDYMMYGDDKEFVAKKLMTVRNVLDFFARFEGDDGRLRNVTGWNFTDWVGGGTLDYRGQWFRGAPVPGSDGSNAVIDLQYLEGLQLAADMEAAVGIPELAKAYEERARRLKAAIVSAYWNAARGLLSDRADRPVFSQHANALALLTGALPSGKALLGVASAVETDTTLTQASLYFKYFVHHALVKAGLGDHYLQWLGDWRENLALGLTTWAEISNVNDSRSDCHAWGCSPNIELLRTVLGVESGAPCFGKVIVEPHLCGLRHVSGTIPHPKGNITVSYQQRKSTLEAAITLPDGVNGTFLWQGTSRPLHGGENRILLTSNIERLND